MGKLKDKLYYLLVEKNPSIREEYQSYVRSHPDEHRFDRKRSLKLLLKLNWHYRILRKKTPYLSGAGRDFCQRTGNFATRLPYLEGSESAGLKREWDAVELAKRLLEYEVISFDIFDTLILRPFERPEDIFMIIGNKLGIMNFKEIRREAEQLARQKKLAKEGCSEVNIHEIYELVSRRTGISAEEGVSAELETELEFCFANPYMERVYKIVKEEEKEILITSDMYIPSDMMKKILKNCGYEGYSRLFVSCDHGCSKSEGGLFKNILGQHAHGRIVHIGDSYHSDVESAKRCGIDAIYYKSSHQIGAPYRADGMSELTGSFYAGIVNTHLHNGSSCYDPYYEYGFIYGGFYIFGFCNYIHKRAKEEGIEKIIFLARDGYVYKKVYDRLFDDIPSEYVFWSRIANTKYTVENARDDFLTRLVRHKAYSVLPARLGQILDSFELSPLRRKLGEYGLSEDAVLTPELIRRFEDFLIDNYEGIVNIYERESEIAKGAFKRITRGSQRVAVVDVGWLGSGPLGVKYLLEKRWTTGCLVKCFIAGSWVIPIEQNLNELMNGEIEPYIFSRMYNRDLFDTHTGTNRGTNNIYFEMFTGAPHPSFSGYSQNGEYIFDVPEVANYPMTERILRGILDFCELYQKFSDKNRYLCNISGYDAYMPFRFAIRDPSLVKLLFSSASFSQGVGLSLESQSQETVADILKSLNL